MENERLNLKHFNICAFIILFLVVFILITLKVLNVPITHDETSTAVHYSNFTVWQIMMYPDNWPNNHILNTLLVKFSIWVFGVEQWSIRLPNLISFLVYVFAIFRIVKMVLRPSSLLFIPAAILFICNPYLLDFFGLCRGYAMSVAFCTLSVSFLISGFLQSRQNHVWLSLLFAALASYANFTALIFLAAVTGTAWFYFFMQFRTERAKILQPTFFIFLFILTYAALIAVPIIKMQSTDQFHYWQTSGFYRWTILPLINVAYYSETSLPPVILHSIAIFSIVMVLGNVIYIVVKFFRGGFKIENFRTPVFLAPAVLLLTIIVNVLQCWILKTPNLYERLAIFYYPLFTISLVTTLSLIPHNRFRRVQTIFSIIFSSLLLFHIANKTEFNTVREWSFNNGTNEIIDYFEKVCPSKAITLSTDWLFWPSFYFYKYAGKIPMINLEEKLNQIDTNSDAEYYYVTREDFQSLRRKFEMVYRVDDKSLLLKRRINEFRGTLVVTEYVKFTGNPVRSAPNPYESGGDSLQFPLMVEEFSPGFCRNFYFISCSKRFFLHASAEVFPLEEIDSTDLNIIITREKFPSVLNFFASGKNQRPKLKPGCWSALSVNAMLPVAGKDEQVKVFLMNSKKKRILVTDFRITYFER